VPHFSLILGEVGISNEKQALAHSSLPLA